MYSTCLYQAARNGLLQFIAFDCSFHPIFELQYTLCELLHGVELNALCSVPGNPGCNNTCASNTVTLTPKLYILLRWTYMQSMLLKCQIKNKPLDEHKNKIIPRKHHLQAQWLYCTKRSKYCQETRFTQHADSSILPLLSYTN